MKVVPVGFQSLIGRLQTSIYQFFLGQVVSFQSLIGRLQTVLGDIPESEIEIVFQSLIGRLQTNGLSW